MQPGRAHTYAVRSLRNAPRFTIAVIATPAPGLGANTAVFSVLDAALLTPLPYPDAHRLVRVHYERDGEPRAVPRPPRGCRRARPPA